MDYKLIKLKEGYIIVSNEEIENYYFNNHTKEIYLETHPKRLEVTNKELNKEIRFKIIASTFIPELPNIDFNNLEEEFGIIDVEKLAKEANGYLPYARDTKGVAFNEGFIEGFNKCLELNKDKLLTLDDISNFRKILEDGVFSNMSCSSAIVEFDKFIKSLQKTERDIKIETEYIKDFYRDGFGGAGTIDIKQPKITNNKIKILKIK